MAAIYSASSPYHGTNVWGEFLDVWAGKTIVADASDSIYQIDNPYNMRPDLFAYDMYGDSSFWWVFAVRNPDIIKDPLLSFKTGTIIYVPTLSTIKQSLGLI